MIIQYGKLSFTLDAFLWRDFELGESSAGEPLTAIIRLTPVAGSSLPPSLEMERVIIKYPEGEWTSKLALQRSIGELEGIAVGGPRLAVGTSVTLTVVISNSGDEPADYKLSAEVGRSS